MVHAFVSPNVPRAKRERGPRHGTEFCPPAGPISTAGTDTIATARAVPAPIPESLARILALVDDIVLVDDDDLRSAQRRIAGAVGLLIEPAGVAGVAALERHRERLPGRLIAVLLTGADPRET
jgi:threonine dehydratase